MSISYHSFLFLQVTHTTHQQPPSMPLPTIINTTHMVHIGIQAEGASWVMFKPARMHAIGASCARCCVCVHAIEMNTSYIINEIYYCLFSHLFSHMLLFSAF